MTVAELIDKLQAMPSDMEVVFLYDSRVCVCEITHVEKHMYEDTFSDTKYPKVFLLCESPDEYASHEAGGCYPKVD